MGKARQYKVKKVSPGSASGPAVVMNERITMLGTVIPEQGVFIRRGTELEGVSIAGKVLFFISGKGSSIWSAYFKIACRHNNAPAAVVNAEVDPFVALACVLNDIPMVQLEDAGVLDIVKTGDLVDVDADLGVLTVKAASD